MTLTYTLLREDQVSLINPLRQETGYGLVQLQPQLIDTASQDEANTIAGTTGLTYYALIDSAWCYPELSPVQPIPEHARYFDYLSACPSIDDPVLWEPAGPP